MNAKLTQDELQAIKERAETASSGPWKLTIARDGNFAISNEGSPEYVATYLYERDAEFIAASRQDIPKLVAEVERLQAEVTDLNLDAKCIADATDIVFSALSEENERLRKALEYYANPDNWETFAYNGYIAREALK